MKDFLNYSNIVSEYRSPEERKKIDDAYKAKSKEATKKAREDMLGITKAKQIKHKYMPLGVTGALKQSSNAVKAGASKIQRKLNNENNFIEYSDIVAEEFVEPWNDPNVMKTGKFKNLAHKQAYKEKIRERIKKQYPPDIIDKLKNNVRKGVKNVRIMATGKDPDFEKNKKERELRFQYDKERMDHYRKRMSNEFIEYSDLMIEKNIAMSAGKSLAKWKKPGSIDKSITTLARNRGKVRDPIDAYEKAKEVAAGKSKPKVKGSDPLRYPGTGN